MLRRANESESAAFLLVERTIRRTRPQVGNRGLESIEMSGGTIERGSFGRLRLRFDGGASHDSPHDGHAIRALSDVELLWWTRIEQMFTELDPIADSEGNLISMRIGTRRFRRLPLGTVVASGPNDATPFETAVPLPVPEVQPQSDVALASGLPSRREVELLLAIDRFLQETDGVRTGIQRTGRPWSGRAASNGGGHLGASSPLVRGRTFGHRKWSKCPLCHAPVVRGRFNPRIPLGRLRPGTGSIKDLRGGYLSRLRETYIVEEPMSVLEPPEATDDDSAEVVREPGLVG